MLAILLYTLKVLFIFLAFATITILIILIAPVNIRLFARADSQDTNAGFHISLLWGLFSAQSQDHPKAFQLGVFGFKPEFLLIPATKYWKKSDSPFKKLFLSRRFILDLVGLIFSRIKIILRVFRFKGLILKGSIGGFGPLELGLIGAISSFLYGISADSPCEISLFPDFQSNIFRGYLDLELRLYPIWLFIAFLSFLPTKPILWYISDVTFLGKGIYHYK